MDKIRSRTRAWEDSTPPKTREHVQDNSVVTDVVTVRARDLPTLVLNIIKLKALARDAGIVVD